MNQVLDHVALKLTRLCYWNAWSSPKEGAHACNACKNTSSTLQSNPDDAISATTKTSLNFTVYHMIILLRDSSNGLCQGDQIYCVYIYFFCILVYMCYILINCHMSNIFIRASYILGWLSSHSPWKVTVKAWKLVTTKKPEWDHHERSWKIYM